MQTLAEILFIAITSGAAAYFGSYLREKGKNQATSEDINRLTRIVEDIKSENAHKLAEITHQNAVLIEQMKGQHQLRVAAIDRRLQAHQEAFALWRKINQHLSSPELHSIIAECDQWWTNNCLYLEDNARTAFSDAYWNAFMLRQYERADKIHDNLTQAIVNARIERMKKISEAGNLIAKSVTLPGLSNEELETATRPRPAELDSPES